MTTGINWRKFPRISSKIEAELHVEDKFVNVQAVTENIGTGGVCVILNHEVEKFDTINVKLCLEDNLPPIKCAGRIVWTIQKKIFGQKKPTFDVGIEFTEINDDALSRIKNFILREERR